jgi:hypothetical protein
MGVAIALAAAARSGRIAAPERLFAQVAYLLGGSVAGLVALAFPPAWPLLAAALGMLAIQAARLGRMSDVGLLLSGSGATWTLMGGLALLNDLTDPAVSSPGAALRLAVGMALVAVGLMLAVRRREHVS